VGSASIFRGKRIQDPRPASYPRGHGQAAHQGDPAPENFPKVVPVQQAIRTILCTTQV